MKVQSKKFLARKKQYQSENLITNGKFLKNKNEKKISINEKTILINEKFWGGKIWGSY